MANVLVRQENDGASSDWLVTVAGMEVRFASQAEAQAYAEQLQSRISAPHDLPYEALPISAEES